MTSTGMPRFIEKHGPAVLIGLTALLLLWRFWVVPRLGITLYVDEAQYWTWAQQLDWGYFSKPPGVAFLIWLSTSLFGDGLLGVKALAMLCYPLTAACSWLIARRLYDLQTAFWSALAILTLPIFSWLGLVVSTDALLTLFWALALWAYLRALDGDRWTDWLLLGVFCGLGLLSKYTMLAWLGTAFLHLAFFHRERLLSPKPWFAALLSLLILAPNIWWNITHDFPTLKHTADITVNKKASGGLKPLAEFWAAQWGCFGPIFGSVFFVLLFQARQSWRDTRSRLLLWFALPLWLVVSLQAFTSKANANWAAPSFTFATIVVIAWLVQRQKYRLLIAGLVLNCLLMGGAYHWQNLLSIAGVQNTARLDPYLRTKGWDKLGQQLKPLLEAHPNAILIADNRTLLAHMLYELRDIHPQAASWNPEGTPSDHYKLTTDLRPYAGKGTDMLFISEGAINDSFAPRFRGIKLLATLKAPLDAKTTRDMNVYLLHDFQGY